MVAILVRLSQSDFLSFYSSDLQPTVLTAILLSSRRVNKPLWWVKSAKQTPDFPGHTTYWYERKFSEESQLRVTVTGNNFLHT